MQHVLIVATSGRALAQCAARSGYSSVVLDCFGDQDTRRTARSSDVVANGSGVEIDNRALLAAAERLSPPAETDALLYGAGFESNPALLEQFSRRYALYGNSPDVIRRVKTPQSLTRLLDMSALPHPPIRMTPPDDPRGWLIKRIGGTGGMHVQLCGDRQFEPGADYFQRHVHGIPCSALFLADLEGVQLVGFSQMLPADNCAATPFAYGGAISHAAISSRVQEDLTAKLGRLADIAGLVGLNGVDFIVDGDNYAVIEINPRPTATLELYDSDVADGLLAAHIAACAGEQVGLAQSWGPIRANAIVYAENPIRIAPHWRPARWCSDIPQPNSVVAGGMPICSVRAEGDSHAEVLDRVGRYRKAVAESLEELAA